MSVLINLLKVKQATYMYTTTENSRMYTCYTCGGQFAGYRNLLRHKNVWHNRYANSRLVQRERLLGLIENELKEFSKGLQEKQNFLNERERNLFIKERLVINREFQLNNLETSLIESRIQRVNRDLQSLQIPHAYLRREPIPRPSPPPPPPPSEPLPFVNSPEELEIEEENVISPISTPNAALSLHDENEQENDDMLNLNNLESDNISNYSSETEIWEERVVEAIQNEEKRQDIYEKNVEENEKCGVCLQNISDFSVEQVVILRCKHVMCTFCCNSMLSHTLRKCPVCREEF